VIIIEGAYTRIRTNHVLLHRANGGGGDGGGGDGG
jgi:hypothetical protein